MWRTNLMGPRHNEIGVRSAWLELGAGTNICRQGAPEHVNLKPVGDGDRRLDILPHGTFDRCRPLCIAGLGGEMSSIGADALIFRTDQERRAVCAT